MKPKNSSLAFLYCVLMSLSATLWAFELPNNIILDQTHGGDGTGWGFYQCDACHLINYTHTKAKPKLQEIVKQKGYDSCISCHGDNGTGRERQCTTCHNPIDLPYASRQQGHLTHNFQPLDPKNPNAKNVALNDKNCISCHEASNMDGVMDINVDLTRFKDKHGQALSYRYSSDFCLACHNRDNQQKGFEMPNKDFRDPLVAMADNYRFIDKHGHSKGSGQRVFNGLRDTYTYPAVLPCSDCHAMHGTSNPHLIISNAFNGAELLSPEIKQQNIAINAPDQEYAQLCVVCHQMHKNMPQRDLDVGNGLSGVHKINGSCTDCHKHGMAAQTGL